MNQWQGLVIKQLLKQTRRYSGEKIKSSKNCKAVVSLADIRIRWGQEPTGISANLMLLIKFQRLLFIHLYQLQEDEASRPECKDELSGSVSILKKYLTSITDHLADVVTVATSVIEAASVTGMVATADFFPLFFIFQLSYIS